MAIYGNIWQIMTLNGLLWQCMTLYDNLCCCIALYDNAWAMYDKNGWRGIACRGSESQVPSLIDQTLTPGYSRSLFYLRCFFSSSFLLLVFPDIESFSNHILLALALCAFSGSFSVNIFTDYSFGDSQAIPVEFCLLFIKVCLESRQVEIKFPQY